MSSRQSTADSPSRPCRTWTVACAALLLMGLWAAPAPAAPTVGEDRIHVVAPGDDLYGVAYQHGLGLEHVAWANRLPMRLELEPGIRLAIPTRRILPASPPFNGMVLNVPERGLYLFLNGRFRRFYPVAVGRTDFETPRGSFRVISRIKNPTWYPPAWAGLKEKAIPPGPRNPLGDRWIGLSAPRVGLHGTQSPYSIGDAISHGCLRMYPAHVRELFNLVWVGMPIRIEYETAKVGRDDAGRLYVAMFPDIYCTNAPRRVAQRLLRSVGRADVDVSTLPSGVAVALDGAAPEPVAASPRPSARSPVAVAGPPVPPARPPLADPAESPVTHAGSVWIPVSTAESAGLRVFPSHDEVRVLGPRTTRAVILAVHSGPTPGSAWRDGSRILLPLDATLTPFGIPYRWRAETNQLDISAVP